MQFLMLLSAFIVSNENCVIEVQTNKQQAITSDKNKEELWNPICDKKQIENGIKCRQFIIYIKDSSEGNLSFGVSSSGFVRNDSFVKT